MTYKTEHNKWIDEYEETGRNQHGIRYKKKWSSKCINVVKLSAKFSDADDLARLICLSARLGVPVNWDYNSVPQTAYIRLVSADAI